MVQNTEYESENRSAISDYVLAMTRDGPDRPRKIVRVDRQR